jgi:hypothetical protein
MRDLLDLGAMTGPEAFVVGLTLLLCVGGLLLPRFGNAIGRSVLGEDPAVRRWRDAWAARRTALREQRIARKAAQRAARAHRKAALKRPI